MFFKIECKDMIFFVIFVRYFVEIWGNILINLDNVFFIFFIFFFGMEILNFIEF